MREQNRAIPTTEAMPERSIAADDASVRIPKPVTPASPTAAGEGLSRRTTSDPPRQEVNLARAEGTGRSAPQGPRVLPPHSDDVAIPPNEESDRLQLRGLQPALCLHLERAINFGRKHVL